MYEDVVVMKPWGYEYQMFQNEHLGIWYLNINHKARTSLHSHPNKKTGLVVLSGLAKVSFMNGSHQLSSGDKIMIRNGVFHSTEALSEEGIQLLEVETPNDKEDIIRLEDYYGREGKPYENSEHYVVTKDNLGLSGKVNIGNCVLSKHNLTSKNELLNREEAKIIFLEGMIYFKEFCVCGPGDILDTVSLSRLAGKFEVTPISLLEIKLEK